MRKISIILAVSLCSMAAHLLQGGASAQEVSPSTFTCAAQPTTYTADSGMTPTCVGYQPGGWDRM